MLSQEKDCLYQKDRSEKWGGGYSALSRLAPVSRPVNEALLASFFFEIEYVDDFSWRYRRRRRRRGGAFRSRSFGDRFLHFSPRRFIVDLNFESSSGRASGYEEGDEKEKGDEKTKNSRHCVKSLEVSAR